MQVELCFDSSPKYLYTSNERAIKIISDVKWSNENSSKLINPNNDQLILPFKQQGCLSYYVDFMVKDLNKKPNRFKKQHPHDSIIPIDLWLWKRSDSNSYSESIINFSHANNVRVSAPWSLINRSELRTKYLMKYTPDSWTGYVAFGSFNVKNIKIDNGTIRLALINGTVEFNREKLVNWVTLMAQAVASIGHAFPLEQVQVMVLLLEGEDHGPVPWGQVNRAGDSGVFFIVNPQEPQDELIEDWTAAHEFSHLLLPSTDRWLSEGFASYYQNISRARTKLIDEQSMWENLIAGLLRGEKASKKKGANNIGSKKDIKRMQTYWGGAAFALMTDVELQEQTKGGFSLSKSIKEFAQCCLQTGRDWDDQEILERLDKISKTTVFTDLYWQEVKRKKFPAYHKTLEKLGITITDDEQIILDSNQTKAKLRYQVING